MLKTRIKVFTKRSLALFLSALMLISSIGIGSMITIGAANIEKNKTGGQSSYNWYGNVFFRAPDSWNLSTNSYVYCVITRNSSDSGKSGDELYKNVWQMSVVGTTSNSRLYYAHINADHSGWGQSEYLAFVAHNSTINDEERWSLTSKNLRTSTIDYGVANDNGSYLFSPSDDANNIAGNDNVMLGSYNGTDRDVVKKNQDFYVYTNGGPSAAGGSVKVDAYYANGSNYDGSSAIGTSSITVDSNDTNAHEQYGGAVEGTKLTLTATPADGYEFQGYYDAASNGNEITSPYYVFGGKSIYARFTKADSDDYRTWTHHDSRWSSTSMGTGTLGNGGAPTTAITKLAIQAGLRDAHEFNIGSMATLLTVNNGYDGSNIIWAAPTNASLNLFTDKEVFYDNNTGSSASGKYSTIISKIREGWHIIVKVVTSTGGVNYVAVDEKLTLASGSTVYIMDCLSNTTNNINIALAKRYSTVTQIIGYKGEASQNSSINADYRKWELNNTNWADTVLNGTYTMNNSVVGGGDLVLASTKLAIQAGLWSDNTIGGVNSVNRAKAAIANFASGGILDDWEDVKTAFGFESAYQQLEGLGTVSNKTAKLSTTNNTITSGIINKLNQGYCLVIRVNSSVGWVAVDTEKTLSTGEIYIMRSTSNASKNADIKLSDYYDTINRVAGFKVEGVQVNISGNASFTASYTLGSGNVPFFSGSYVPNGAEVTIMATPNTGYIANNNWTITDGYDFTYTTASSCAFTVNTDVHTSTTVTYIPTPANHDIEYIYGANYIGFNYTSTPNSAGTGDEVVIQASPKDNGSFVYELVVTARDSDGNEITITHSGNDYRFIMPNANVTVTFIGERIEDWRKWARDDPRWRNYEMAKNGSKIYTINTSGGIMISLAKMVIQAGLQTPTIGDNRTFDARDVVDRLKADPQSTAPLNKTTADLTFGTPVATRLGFSDYEAIHNPSALTSAKDILENSENRYQILTNLKAGKHQIIRLFEHNTGTFDEHKADSEWFIIDEEKTLAAAGNKTQEELALSDIYIYRATGNADKNSNYTLQDLYNDKSYRYIYRHYAFLGGTTPSRKINYTIKCSESEFDTSHKGEVAAEYTINGETKTFYSGDYIPSRSVVKIKYNADPGYYYFVNWTTQDTSVTSLSSTETSSTKEFTVNPSDFRTNATKADIDCNITPEIYNVYFSGGTHFSFTDTRQSGIAGSGTAGYYTFVNFTVNPGTGYSLEQVSVTFKDTDDQVISVQDLTEDIPNGAYTFRMPAMDVSVKLKYKVTAGSNTSHCVITDEEVDSNTVYVDGFDSDTLSVMLTEDDKLKPIVAAYEDGGYYLDHIELRDPSGLNVIGGYESVYNDVFGPMPPQPVKVYAVFAAIMPQLSSSINAAKSVQSDTNTITTSAYSISGVYAGQSITITPSVTSDSKGNITYTHDNIRNDSATITNNNDGTFTFVSDDDIGADIEAKVYFSFDIIPRNTPNTDEQDITAIGVRKTVTICVEYSPIQKEYVQLCNQYSKYNDYNIQSSDTNSGFDGSNGFSNRLSQAKTVVDEGMPDYNSSVNASHYSTPRVNLINAFNGIDFKKTTIYTLVNGAYDSSSGDKYVNIHIDSACGWFADKNTANRVNNTDDHFRMTKECVTVNGKVFYSFTFYGKADFEIYQPDTSTDTTCDGNHLTDVVCLMSATSDNAAYFNDMYNYGRYYIDLKNVTKDNTAANVSDVIKYVDFSMTDNKAVRETGDNESEYDNIIRNREYTLSDMLSYLGISYYGTVLDDMDQTVAQSFTITGPIGRDDVASSDAVLSESQSWTPQYPGKYTFTLEADLDSGDININSEVVLRLNREYTLYVAYDDVTVYADMNGNVGTPALHFSYTDNGQQADLPYELDMVTGAESIYSTVLKLSDFDNHGFTNILTNGLTVNSLTVDNDRYDKSLDIKKQAFRTGTVWLKADSTHMTCFETISYNCASRNFRAVYKNADNDEKKPVTKGFASVKGTGVINDDLFDNGTVSVNDDYYNYNVFYAEYDSFVGKKFAYNVKVSAQQDITITSNNVPGNYYLDHWENENGVEVTDVVSGADINLNSCPNPADVNKTYIAVYRPVSYRARVEITYHFNDFDTSDGNYEYNASKPRSAQTYVKTAKLGTGDLQAYSGDDVEDNALSIASAVAPKIVSNYFNYTCSSAAYVSYDVDTNKYKINANYNETAITYKMVIINTDGDIQDVKEGYYQQPLKLKASTYGITGSDSYHWSVYDGATPKTAVSFDSQNQESYIAPDKVSFTPRFSNYEGNADDKVQIIRLYSGTDTVSPSSSISYGYSITYYENDTKKAQHNFYIIDVFNSSNGTFVGGGVVYATANGTGGNYRQTNAQTVLGGNNTDNKITQYINSILNPYNDASRAKYNVEFKAQTINNIGFRYLPYEKGQDVFRYSNGMGAYIYTFAGTNTNNLSLDGQTLRIFSFFVYDNKGTKNVVVSSTYAQCFRYVT